MSRQRTSGSATSLVSIGSTGAYSYYGKRFGVYPGLPLVEHTTPISVVKGMYLNSQESITDEVDGFGRFNSCIHTKSIPWNFQVPLANYKGTNYTYVGYTDTRIGQNLGKWGGEFSAHTFFSSRVIPSPSFASIPWDNMVESAGVQLDGSMTAGSNLVVTLVELPKTIQMIRNPFRLVSGWRKVAGKTAAKTLAKQGADCWLEYRYGWKQLYSDVVNFSRVFKEVDAHIKYLQQHTGSWESIGTSYRETLTNWATPLDWGTPAYGTLWIKPKCTEATLDCHFTLDIWRDEAYRKWSYLSLLQQRLGTNDLIGILWELVPFSFCVDWFIDASKFLTYKPIFWNQHKLRRMGYSIKTTQKMSLDISSRAYTVTGNTSPVETVSIPEQLVYKSYTRSAGFPPDTTTVGLFAGLNLTHLADSAAIIAQRI